MLKAGLTGGLACGKSFIARELERLGCRIVQADALGHKALEPDGEAYGPVRELFGEGILKEDARIDRSLLAARVFHDSEALAHLNAIVHPAVQRRENELIAAITGEDPDAIIIVEAAILIEARLHKRYDRLILVTCDPDRQLERALARDGEGKRTDIMARIDRQLPPNEKRKYADFLIDTSGTEQETLRQTNELFATLRRLARRRSPETGRRLSQ